MKAQVLQLPHALKGCLTKELQVCVTRGRDAWDMLRPMPKLDRPVFLVGCAKSGTTVLGQLMAYHPELGPKDRHVHEYPSLQSFIDSIYRDNVHDVVAHQMEEKEVWDQFFPINGVHLRQGKELTLLRNPLSPMQQRLLVRKLTRRFRERRFFSKQPFNTFRLHALREMFPDAKFIAIHRDGRDVISSWNRKNNFGQFGELHQAVQVFARKWQESIEHIERYKDELQICTLLYEDLIQQPAATLKQIFAHCELGYYPELYDGVRLKPNCHVWRDRLPAELHPMVEELTSPGRRMLGMAA